MSVERLSPSRTKQIPIREGGKEESTCSASCSFFASLSSIICLVFSMISSSLLSDEPLGGRVASRTSSDESTGGLDDDVDGGTSMFSERWWRMFKWWIPTLPHASTMNKKQRREERTDRSTVVDVVSLTTRSVVRRTLKARRTGVRGEMGVTAHLAVPTANWPNSVAHAAGVSSLSSSSWPRWSEEAWGGAVLHRHERER